MRRQWRSFAAAMENVGGSGDDGWRRRWLKLAPAVAWAVAENMNLKMAALGQINLEQKRVALDYDGNRGRLPMQLCTELRSATRHSFTKLYKGAMIYKGAMMERHNFLSTMTTNNTIEEGSEQKETISVTFIDKDGEENHIKVPVGMSMLEAAHENDIELEGACEGSLACSTCHVIVMDVEHYNKLEDPTDEENDMLDLAFGLSETSRLGCQVIAKPELDGIRLAIPAATRNFAVDGFVPKPH
ncbi:adrenodoxin-like protein 2, mitochondrial isoform X2 [Phaseolus vulgaris]|uniref:adrenodoxin-like protein 2, mitochondrial isoform X2 n=1 Tax=Phaseolus vulgaris TaxID=3885 RepID=UPI0035CB8962